MKYRNYANILDLDKDNKVTEKELNYAKKILEKAKK